MPLSFACSTIFSYLCSLSDSPKCVKEKAFSDNVEISRRRSAGKPIYVDNNILAYTITGNCLNDGGRLKYLDSVYNYLGGRIAKSIEEVAKVKAERVEIREHFAIKVDGKPIAGNAQYPVLDRIFFYHGVLAVGAWDADRINEFLRIPEKDLDELHKLPNILGISDANLGVSDAKSRMVKHILANITDGDYREIEGEKKKMILDKADGLVKEAYGTKDRILRSDKTNLNENSRFCLLYPD